MSQRDGGPAFPTVAKIEGGYIGMSLRDYFAGMALQGMLTLGPIAGQDHIESQVQHCWRLADAMLKQRAATP